MKDIDLKIHSWQEVSINTYYDIVDILEDNEIEEYEKNIKILSIICGVDEQKIWDLPILDVKALISKCGWVNNFSFNKNMKFNKIKLNNEKYIVDADLQHFTTAQYIDFQTLWAKKDLKKYYGNILACFIIPRGKTYGNDYDISELAAEIRNTISIVTANEILFFFLKGLVSSIRAIKIYLDFMMKKAMKKQKDPEKMKPLMKQWEQTQQIILDGLIGWTLSQKQQE